MMRTVQAEWEEFERRVMPRGAPPVQRNEMRRAFFAGAYGMLSMSAALGNADVPEDDAVASLEGWKNEIEAFFSAGGSAR